MIKFKKIIRILSNRDVAKNIHLIFLNRILKKSYQNKYKKTLLKKSVVKKNLKIFSDCDLDSYNKYFSENIKIILEKSDGYLNNTFHLLGADFNFKNDINWHYDPNDKIEWMMKVYDERNIHYSGSPKDVKIVWELNRHQYLFTVAKSFFITKDSKYSDYIVSHLLSWIEQNPAGKGINWASPMEVSIRLISWLLIIDLLEETEQYKNNEEKILSSISEHITFIKYHLSKDRLIHTNHLIGELTGLIVSCMVFDYPGNEKTRIDALYDLVKELKDQVFDDGVSKEQSTSYHRFVVDFLTLIVVISNKSGIEIPRYIQDTLEQMINYVSYAVMPDGRLPMIGDADNGRGIPITMESDFWDCQHVLSNGAILFYRGDFKKTFFGFNEESFWLFGHEGKYTYDSITPVKPDFYYTAFKFAGHYILGNKISGFYFFVRGGVFGMGGDYFSSHSHFDLLSPVIYIQDKPFFTDCGTYKYNGDNVNRSKFRSSEYHNNISWNLPIAVQKLNFGWEKVCNSILAGEKVMEKGLKLKFSLENVGNYVRKFIIKNNFVQIIDTFKEEFKNLSWNFHIPAGWKIIQKDDNSIMAMNCKVVVIFKSNIGGLRVEEGEVSYNYGEKETCYLIHFNHSVHIDEQVWFSIDII